MFRTFGSSYGADAISREEIAALASSVGLRLPSEIEWEYACKAGSQTLFYWGNEPDDSLAWTNSSISFAPGEYRTLCYEEQKPPNAFGLLGMIGNLGEWVQDDAYDFQAHQPSTTPYKSHIKDADGILRGGFLDYGWNFNRSTSRIRCGAADTGCSARLAFGLSELLEQ